MDMDEENKNQIIPLDHSFAHRVTRVKLLKFLKDLYYGHIL